MNKKNMIAPIVIGTLVVIQSIAVIIAFIVFELGLWWIISIVLLYLIEAMIIFYVVRERILEIKGGEEDDLSKY